MSSWCLMVSTVNTTEMIISTTELGMAPGVRDRTHMCTHANEYNARTHTDCTHTYTHVHTHTRTCTKINLTRPQAKGKAIWRERGRAI